eukprot:5028452-Pyramimonas_sp.AAC.1
MSTRAKCAIERTIDLTSPPSHDSYSARRRNVTLSSIMVHWPAAASRSSSHGALFSRLAHEKSL